MKIKDQIYKKLNIADNCKYNTFYRIKATC